MGSSERLCLRWNDFESNIKHGFSELRQDEEFFDVTLACGSRQIKAHKVILSACSPFFRSIIRAVPHHHPLLYLRGIKFNHLESLLSFMYNGEVNVTQEELNSFLAVAEELKIKGLTQNNATDGHHDVKPKSEGSFDSAPPAKRPRPASVKANSSASSSPAPSTSSNRRSRPADEVEEIEEVAPVKSEPKDNNSSNLVVEPELGDDMGAGGDDYGPGDEENYDDYGQYGSESGDMSYGEGGSMMDASMAVAGPSGSADGNKVIVAPNSSTTLIHTQVPFTKSLTTLYRILDNLVLDMTERERGLHTCKVCLKAFKHVQHIRAHIECNHILNQKIPCQDCGKLLKNRPSLKYHLRSCSKIVIKL